jgi:3-dehydroquinate synthase
VLKIIRVKLKNNPYNVEVGYGLLKSAGSIIKKMVPGKRAMIISNPRVFKLHGAALKRSLAAHFDTSVFLMPDGEKYKNIETLSKIYDACAKNRLNRQSVIVALGGGVVGDTAGFAAATYMRGIAVVQVPTTLLAMADSSIGGKTGIDIKAGKNLAGAFHQPKVVIMDLNTLKTLDPEEYKNGLAEMIKHGIIADEKYFNFIKNNKDRIMKQSGKAVFHLVARSAEIKAKVVGKDEKETKGIRAILNYGHTIGHAIEAEGGYNSYKHGQAIVLGMIAAAAIANAVKLCEKDVVDEQINVFKLFNLIKPLRKLEIGSIIKRLYGDKKAKDGKIIFVLTKKIGHAKLNETIPITIIKAELIKLFDSAAQGGTY